MAMGEKDGAFVCDYFHFVLLACLFLFFFGGGGLATMKVTTISDGVKNETAPPSVILPR